MHFISPTGEYPVYFGKILETVEGYKLGDEIPDGWTAVKDSPIPVCGPYEKPNLLQPVEIDGVLTQQWEIIPFTDEERAAKDAKDAAFQKLTELGLSEEEIYAIINNG